MNVDGGAPQVVCDNPEDGRGAGGSWAEDGLIHFTLGDSNGILAVSARGGTATRVVRPDLPHEQDIHDPYVIPGGRGILFSAHIDTTSYTMLYHILDGNRVLLFDGGDDTVESPAWCETGHVLFQVGGATRGIWAVPYDPAGQELLGDPFLVMGEGLWPSVSRDGTLLCGTGSGVQDWQLVKVDRTGNEVARYGEPQEFFPFLSLDPAERRVILSVSDDSASQLWMLDLERGTQSRLTFDDNTYSNVTWFPDGQDILATGGDGGPGTFDITLMSVEGRTEPRTLVQGLFPELSPDGEHLVFSYFAPEGGIDIGRVDLAEAMQAAPEEPPATASVVADPDWQYGPRISPDGRWVAYVSRETGRDEVYLRRFPEGDQKRQVSADGGGWPLWNGAGDRLYYMSGLDMVEVEIIGEPSLLVGSPEVLFRRPRGTDTFSVGWPLYFQVTRDGGHFFMLYETDEADGNRPLMFVQNWAAEFTQDGDR
jgi:Tol biopolymer transport system component